jgi:hypothetical protein
VTFLGKSRLNKRRCENCGHPKRKGKLCRITGVEMQDCVGTSVHIQRIEAVRRALRPRKGEN